MRGPLATDASGMATSKALRAIALAVTLPGLLGLAGCAAEVTQAAPAAPSPTVSAETPAPQTPEDQAQALFADYGVADWRDGEQGLMVDPATAPGAFPAELAPLVHVHLASWLGAASLDPAQWAETDSQIALDRFIKSVPAPMNDVVKDRWANSDLKSLSFVTRFGDGVTVIGAPKVKALEASTTNGEGLSQFILGEAAVYAVDYQEEVYLIPVVRQLSLASPESGDYARAGDYTWQNLVNGSGVTCESIPEGRLVPDADDTKESVMNMIAQGEAMLESTARGQMHEWEPVNNSCDEQ